MTPHGTLEAMAKVRALAGNKFDEMFHGKVWDAIAGMLKASVHFEFGAAAPLTAHVEFGCDLMDRGLFRLPFDTVFYTSQSMPSAALLCEYALIPEAIKPIDLQIVTMSPAISKQSGETFLVPMLLVQAIGSSWDDLRIEWKALCKREMYKRTGQAIGQAECEENTFKALRFATGATTMLMSKDVDVSTEPAPAKLNTRRAAQGRVPVGERRIVRIKIEHRKAYARAADDQRAGRGSVRMHLRRGHFRQVRQDLIVPVAPSIINAGDGAKPIAKAYQVQT